MGLRSPHEGKSLPAVSYTHLDVYKRQATEYVRGIPVVKVFQQTVYSFKSFHAAILSYRELASGYAMM